ncbi:MAG: hypothetical protein IJP94_01085, partial [Clostridia bacterium]|nr:hypothetical protein [Clostridia bacterium]
TKPATAFIFSAIENKYADAIDNFPVPNLLEREPSDQETAKILSKIIPAQLDMSGFKKVYKKNWRRKLKDGTGIYGVFYNEDREDIDIRPLGIMDVYCDMYLTDVQESQFFFIAQAIDNAILKDAYPKYKDLFRGDADIQSYKGDSEKLEDKTEVIDCYYKKTDGTLHMIKLVGNNVILATEDMDGYENGLYDHGMYPVIFDVLYPEEDCPFGFGVVDVIKNPQMYVDKLDGIILKNAMLSGNPRTLMKNSSGINENEFKDYTNDIVHCTGDVGEQNIRTLTVDAIPQQVMSHRDNKKNELKEVVGNRDFQQGGTMGGVTAASAITSLQQAGEKLSRAIIDDSYDVYKDLVIMVISLMREFYTEERVYRITNEMGSVEFKEFDSSMLMKPETDALGFPIDEYKRVEFDIGVIPQRENPFSKEANNQTIMNLWQSGFFLPQNLGVATVALQCMNFDGKEKLMEQLREMNEQQQMAQQQQMMQQQMPQGGGDLIPVGQVGDSQIESEDDLVPVGQVGGEM